jgi:hypothetical protein
MIALGGTAFGRPLCQEGRALMYNNECSHKREMKPLVILATQEAEIRRITVQSKTGKIVR